MIPPLDEAWVPCHTGTNGKEHIMALKVPGFPKTKEFAHANFPTSRQCPITTLLASHWLAWVPNTSTTATRSVDLAPLWFQVGQAGRRPPGNELEVVRP
jgi:hypothetical protein